MSQQQETKFVAEKSTAKKISFFSAMLIVIGGSIGAGIFFKSGNVLANSQGSLLLAAFSWIIASFAVIAMALALIEIASVRNDNLSLIGWNKVFNKKITANASKNFMVYIYLPLTYFFMPLYVIMSLQDGLGALLDKDAAVFGTNVDWLIWTIISLAMSAYFLTIPTLWSRVGDVQNKIVTAIKFFPLVFIAIIGFVLAITKTGGQGDVTIKVTEDITKTIANGKEELKNIGGFGAFLGIFLSMTAIFFAYDGFYVAAGISSEMKEPKKTPLALFLGLAITTVIYLIIAISMSINGGSFFGMRDFMANLMGATAAKWLFGIMNIAIAIGVLGIINGFSMWAPRYVEDLLATGELPFWEKVYKKLNPNKPVIGVIYSIVITIPVVLLFTIIGAIAYIPNADYDIYGSGMASLYAFADLMANWTALFTFAFIVMAIFGGIVNRRTKRIEIPQKSKYFLVWAWISVILIFAALIVSVLEPAVNLMLLIGFRGTTEELMPILIGRIMLLVTLLIYVILSYGVTFIENEVIRRKYGSVEKFEEYKKGVLKI